MYTPAVGRELDGFREQIPRDLRDPLRIAGPETHPRVERRRNSDLIGVGGADNNRVVREVQ